MRTTLFSLAVAIATLPMDARAQEFPTRWAILHYISSEPITEEALRPVVAYVDERGEAIDWLFDGVILYSIRLYHYNGHPTEADVTEYTDSLFTAGGLVALADTVASLRGELGDPTYRLRIYFDGIGVTEAEVADRTAALVEQYEALGRDELELAGFYWGWDEAATSSETAAITAFT
jgi:hypothetical protein